MYTLDIILDSEKAPLYEPRKCTDLQCFDKKTLCRASIGDTEDTDEVHIYGPEIGASNMSPRSPTSAPRLLRVLRLSAHAHGQRENESDQFSDAGSQARQRGCPWH